MAFTLSNWACISSSMNQGQETVTPFLGVPTLLNAPNVFVYGSELDTVATILVNGYFNSQVASLSVNDWIMGNGSDSSFTVKVFSIIANVVVVVSTGLTSPIGTANIQDSAVTALKLATDSVTTVKILAGNVTLAKLSAGLIPSHVIKFAAELTTVGGNATEAFVVTGAAATDRAFIQMVNDGTGNVTVLEAVVTLNTLTVTFSANPGNNTRFNYQLIRIAS